MEKLQAALDLARQQRGDDRKTQAQPLRRAATAGAEIQEAWRQIPRLEIDPKRLLKKRLVSLEGGSVATPFDVLRTKILQLAGANGWRRIAVTSPAPSSGKTTTSANLAIALSRQVDLRVVLMDLDLRRPALAKLIGHREQYSVSDFLEERVSFAEQARRIGDNLALAMNYSPSSDPSDLFLRQRTSELIDEIDRSHAPDVMLFDMPPMMVNDDTSAFLKNVDCALIIAEAGVSTISQVDLCERELAAQTNVLGVVLNKCKFQSDGYGFYYYNYNY